MRAAQIKLLSGNYLTQTEREHITHLIKNNYVGKGFLKVNRKVYNISEIEDDKYNVIIREISFSELFGKNETINRKHTITFN